MPDARRGRRCRARGGHVTARAWNARVRSSQNEAAVRLVDEAAGRRPAIEIVTARARAAIGATRELGAVRCAVAARAGRARNRVAHRHIRSARQLERCAGRSRLHHGVARDARRGAMRALEGEREARVRCGVDRGRAEGSRVVTARARGLACCARARVAAAVRIAMAGLARRLAERRVLLHAERYGFPRR